MTVPLLLLPWIAFAVVAYVKVRGWPPLPPLPPPVEEPPLVSVIVPARDEERNIERCLSSIARSEYARFEIIVVDDRSGDRTAELAGGIAAGNAGAVRLVRGEPLPEGWFGKPWACHQGVGEAHGDILLFTDADTIHAPDLLARAVAALRGEEADALSLAGRQILGSFWERVVQPQVLLLVVLSISALGRRCTAERWREGFMNGQFIMVRRGAYEDVGGHGSVRNEVVEDVRFAQVLCRSGKRVFLFAADTAFHTRMYRSLGEVVGGWSKNLAIGSRQSFPGWLAPVALPAATLMQILLWIVPPLVLIVGLLRDLGETLPPAAGLATGFGILFWGLGSLRAGINPLNGLFYPAGASVTVFILLRSWIRGRRVKWKGREYDADPDFGDASA